MLNVIAACRINACCGKKPTIFSVPRLPSCSLGKKGASSADLESPFFSRNVLSLPSIVTSSLIILVAIPFTWSSGKKLLIPREQVRNPFSFFGDDTDTDTNLCDPFAVCGVLCFYIFEDSKISLPPPSPSQPAPCFCKIDLRDSINKKTETALAKTRTAWMMMNLTLPVKPPQPKPKPKLQFQLKLSKEWPSSSRS